MARAWWAASLALAALLTAIPGSGALAQPVPAAREGLINGKPARFVADEANVLLSTAEADRLRIPYRQGRREAVGDVVIWLVTLDSVSVDGRTRSAAQAGVVTDISKYFAVLRAPSNHAKLHLLSRQTTIEVNGKTVQAFDMSIGGYLLPTREAERIGLAYRQGQRSELGGPGGATVWVVRAGSVKANGVDVSQLPVTVGDPELVAKAIQGVVDGAVRK